MAHAFQAGPWVRIEPGLKHYPWGDAAALPQLLGRAADGRPWAEAWFGAHAAAPSQVLTTPAPIGLDACIAEQPQYWLGVDAAARWQRLPFLLKLLTAARPLSIQVHPDAGQARAGFDREDAAGIPRDAATRCYPDAMPKPELLLALTPFDALCGFRAAHEIGALLACCAPLAAALPTPASAADLRQLLGRWYAMPASTIARLQGELLAQLSRGTTAVADDAVLESAAALARHLHKVLGDDVLADPGLLFALLLRRVQLQPGEAMFLAAGVPHAYLEGSAVEIMASSDNVLRAGLTSKHVDPVALLEIMGCDETVPPLVAPVSVAPGLWRYPTAAEQFELCLLQPGAATIRRLDPGPELLLVLPGAPLHCSSGAAEIELHAGDALLIAAGQPWSVSGPGAEAVLATLPDASGPG